VAPKKYRAGVSLAAGPKNLPEGLQTTKFKDGKYSPCVLTSGRVFEIVSEKGIQFRDDWCIENYANDPRTTPEPQLITEILISTT